MTDDSENKARDIALEACKIFFSKDNKIEDVFKFIDESCGQDTALAMRAYALVLVNVSYWMANVMNGNPFEKLDPDPIKPLYMKDDYGPTRKEIQPRLFD